MVTTFYPPYHFGGDGVYVQSLTHALARRGHEVEVIHDLDAFVVAGGKERPAETPPPGVTIHTLKSKSSFLATLATQQTGRPLVHGAQIRSILDKGFDVIHYHNVSLVGGPEVLKFGSAVKLYTAHEHWLVCPTHILCRYNREPCSGRECVRCVLAAKRPPQLWRLGSWFADCASHVDEFLALSRFSADKHREFGFGRTMRVFPSFLPAEPKPAPRPKPEVPYFLFVGRLEAIKGLDEVIPLFDPNMPAELWIAGRGADEERLRKLAAGYSKVKFLGFRPLSELRGLYANAVACVTPSRCYEVFPLVVLEAFREGTPIVARNLGPFPEIAEKGTGLLFDTSAQLRDALLRIAANEELRMTLSLAAKREFEATWSEDVVLGKYFEVVGEVAARRGMTDLTSKLEEDKSVP